ncbi:hypothetical protein DFH05DRAFT_1467512 [Lentinula detonsa]|uniref:Uncharacterized protein n=1 Tax=Lentinula detonsa TaxID=2804962 RepID=A0A9W8U2W4_9AGAR|nr:hypothetical protein DFH05DRAFT_1467512 [Lentinula detonsa]
MIGNSSSGSCNTTDPGSDFTFRLDSLLQQYNSLLWVILLPVQSVTIMNNVCFYDGRRLITRGTSDEPSLNYLHYNLSCRFVGECLLDSSCSTTPIGTTVGRGNRRTNIPCRCILNNISAFADDSIKSLIIGLKLLGNRRSKAPEVFCPTPTLVTSSTVTPKTLYLIWKGKKL